jgi:hypothetical protein
VQADLELEHAALRPADELGRLIGEEHVRNEAEQEADGADVEHEGVDEEHAQHVAPPPRALGDGQVHERHEQAQQHHDDIDHAIFPVGSGDEKALIGSCMGVSEAPCAIRRAPVKRQGAV